MENGIAARQLGPEEEVRSSSGRVGPSYLQRVVMFFQNFFHFKTVPWEVLIEVLKHLLHSYFFFCEGKNKVPVG